jgi:putative glycosyltransferase (TIGR04348 family)
MVARPLICLVTPALADANNGNWQTARRWASLLAPTFRVRLLAQWSPEVALPHEAALLALHARRSASSVAAWAQARPGRPLAVVLTGTDVYRDIHHDAAAGAALDAATALVALQDQAPLELGPRWREKCRVIYQSCTPRQPQAKTGRHLRALMVGHLRPEKSPETLLAAARLLRGVPGIRIDHVGAALDPALGELAQRTARDCPNYRWLGALPHEAVRRRIQRAHVLVHPSRMEGGAHVIMEAVASGTPVLASRVSGNVGMLGADYAGYFEWGDAAALAGRLQACADGGGVLDALRAQCAVRARLFDPATERAGLLGLMRDLGVG